MLGRAIETSRKMSRRAVVKVVVSIEVVITCVARIRAVEDAFDGRAVNGAMFDSSKQKSRKRRLTVERMKQVYDEVDCRWNCFGARNHRALGCRTVGGAGLTETIGRFVVGINLIVVMNKLGSKEQKHRASTRRSVAQSIGSGMTTIREQIAPSFARRAA